VVIYPSRTVPVATRHGRVAVTLVEERGRPVQVLIQGASRDIALEAEALARLLNLLLEEGDSWSVLCRAVRALEGLGRGAPGPPALPVAVAQALRLYLESKGQTA